MSNSKVFFRYTRIVEKIRRGQFPSKNQIIEFINEGEYSERTFERDLQQLRNTYSIEVIYDRAKQGYYIDVEASVNLAAFLRFANLASAAELFKESIRNSKESLGYVLFDSDVAMQGQELIEPILSAIKHTQRIQFKHYNFHQNTYSDYVFEPYYLKEYNNRWYVVGYKISAEMKPITRTIGLDRILNLEVLPQTFNRYNEEYLRANFEDIIGIVYNDARYHEKQRVVLSFTPLQGRYVKSLPWHKSMEILVDNNEELRVALYVLPNYELKQLILMQHAEVKVLEPESLVKEIKEALQKTLNQYTPT